MNAFFSGEAQAARLQRITRSKFTGRLAPLRYKIHPHRAKVDGVGLTPLAYKRIDGIYRATCLM